MRQKQSEFPLVGSGQRVPHERLVPAALDAVGKFLSNALRMRERDGRANDSVQVRQSRAILRMLRSMRFTIYCSRVPNGLF